MTIQKLLHKYNKSAVADIVDLFAADPDRFKAFSCEFEGLLLDYSKTPISPAELDDLLLTAEQAGLPAAIKALFSGAVVNRSEGRAAWHSLLRSGSQEESESSAELASERSRMLAIADSLRNGKVPGGADGITDVVHLGIGGSALGPMLVADALDHSAQGNVRVHYLAGSDGHAVTQLLRNLQPKNTAIIIASKSFTTRETLLNANVLKAWLAQNGGHNTAGRMLAITAASGAARDFGVMDELILRMWPQVGGRYSVWSSIGLPAAITLGSGAFVELLEGANSMDRHFRTAPSRFNLPVLLALCGIWHRNVCGYSSLAMMPYDFRLRLLPDWFQQLDMESNGKSMDQDGEPLKYATAPALLGGLGTSSQHSVFQSLHQGTDVIPVEFIGVLKTDHEMVEQHNVQLSNMLAQGEALMRGRSDAETRSFMEEGGLETAQLESQLPHRVFHGNRPSITLLLDQLSPYSLGQLLALYEHKVYVQSVIWNINPFDQWGVEFGKTLAADYERTLGVGAGRTERADDLLSWVMEKLNKSRC